MTKLDALQGQLLNVNMKLDRLLDEEAPRRRRRRGAGEDDE